MISSEFNPEKDKPITVTDIPKIIAKVIIFFIISFHIHLRVITQLPNSLNI
jgi:hypothetical protein